MNTMTTDCPGCEPAMGALTDCPPDECESCDGLSVIPVWCSFCCAAPADRHSNGDPCCRDCEVVRVCGCGEIWHRAEWLNLDIVGVQDDIYPFTHRNCPCGSTLVVKVWVEHDDRRLRAIHRREWARSRFADAVHDATVTRHPMSKKERAAEAHRRWQWVLRWDEAVNDNRRTQWVR